MTPSDTSASDPADMRGQVSAWPELLRAGYDSALPDLPGLVGKRQIVCCGMGGSAIGAGLIGDLIPFSVPFSVVRDYVLPVSVDADSLVICLSHSGGTEEALSCYDQAGERGAARLVITTGGELARRAEADGVTVIRYEHDSQPRAALPLVLGLLCKLFGQLDAASSEAPDESVAAAVSALKAMFTTISSDAVVEAMSGRIPFVYGSGLTTEAARRLKGQVSENAKQTAACEILPEQNHNGLVGLEFPAPLGERIAGVFLRSSFEHPQVAKRFELTHALFTERSIPAVAITGSGEGRLAELCTVLAAGDLASVELAIRNGVDPTPVDLITEFKAKLEQV